MYIRRERLYSNVKPFFLFFAENRETFAAQKPAGAFAWAAFVAFYGEGGGVLSAARLLVFVHAEIAGEACPSGELVSLYHLI